MAIYTLGIDVGSTAPKCIMLKDGKGTASKPLVSVGTSASGPRRATKGVPKNAGKTHGGMDYTLATGCSYNSLEGIADKQMSELPCRAKGALFLLPEMHTVIDIGGQDVKVLKTENSAMVNFRMDDKCVAGTGCFLDVMARVLEINTEDLEKFSAGSTKRIDIDPACTVFAEGEVINQLARGTDKWDIIAGTHRAIAGRIVRLVYRTGLVSDVIMADGVAQNHGIVKALEEQSSCEIKTSSLTQYNGALGAVLFAHQSALKHTKAQAIFRKEAIEMAEEVKNTEAKRPAKKRVNPGVLTLRKVVDDVYEQARETRKCSEPVGWSSSKLPCELAEAFDLKVVYPESQAAGIAANRDGEMLCQAARDIGYDNDVCGYARISLVYAEDFRVSRKFDPAAGEFIISPTGGEPLKDENGNVVINPGTGKPKEDPKTQAPYEELVNINEIETLPDDPKKEMCLKTLKPIRQSLMPMSDFVLCYNNTCSCMTRWYENIARIHNTPFIMIDIPYNNDVEVDDSKVRYIRVQFDAAIKQLEQIFGKKFDEKKLEQACASANRSATVRFRVCDYLQYKSVPMSGFDFFNHMADIVTARGKVEAVKAFEQFMRNLGKNAKEGTMTLPLPEKKRIMFESVPCWPELPQFFKPLKENGISVTVAVHVPVFGFVYKGMDGIARAYCKAPNSVYIEQDVAWREDIYRDSKVDGVLTHYNRFCKPWSDYVAGMQRRSMRDLGVPTAGSNGDQASPRNSNAAQYEARVQGLMEVMEINGKNNETKEA